MIVLPSFSLTSKKICLRNSMYETSYSHLGKSFGFGQILTVIKMLKALAKLLVLITKPNQILK